MDVVNLYTVRDELAEEFGPVFQAKNDNVAFRNVSTFLMKINENDRGFFRLYRIARFNFEKGEFVDTEKEAIDFPSIEKEENLES